MASISGKSYALTAAASGIGLATAVRLATLGARAISMSDMDDSLFPSASEKLLAINPKLQLIQTKVNATDSAALTAWINDTVSQVGALDGCVNCAGTINFAATTTKPLFLSETDETWKHVMEVNLNSVFYSLRAEVAAMIKLPKPTKPSEFRSIVNFSSAASLVHDPTILSYQISKAAVASLTTTISKDVADSGIRVNCVSPSATKTGMALRWYKDEAEAEADMEKRGIVFLEADEVVDVVVYLLGIESGRVSGVNVPVGASSP
jgi:NAD(P)-dependent dehydrogenase (short-subunit alcohol dehydrogenase family)